MVEFVGARSLIEVVAETGIETLFRDLAAAIEADFRRWPEFDLAPRVASHTGAGVIELMPTRDRACYAFKYVNGHPGNPASGRQTVVAFGALADVATGYPVFLSEMTLLTALRTAATSAMAAKALARPKSRVMAIIGLGAQSEFQALAFKALLGIDALRVYDVDPAATEKFLRNMEGRGVRIVVAANAAAAARGADIVTTVTADKRRATVLTEAMVGAGAHLNAVGGDCPGKTELSAGLVRRAEVFVEYEPQTRIEGEIQQMPADFPVTELWRVLTGQAPGRSGLEAITLFDSVGFAIEDFSALRYLRQRVAGTRHVQEIDLIASPADPRDLFGLLNGPKAAMKGAA